MPSSNGKRDDATLEIGGNFVARDIGINQGPLFLACAASPTRAGVPHQALISVVMLPD